MTPIEHIAYHEAGHVVIGLKLGFVVKEVTIKPKSRTLGNVQAQVGEASSNRCVDRDAADIKLCLAGPLAEQLVSPDPFNVQTAALVQQHRDAIGRVATALLEHETLTGDDINSLVNGSGS